MITEETRREGLNKIDKQKRYNEILEVLKQYKNGLTAREIAEKLEYTERNATAPRLTELCGMGKVAVMGKRRDPVSGVNVAVYALKEYTTRTCDCIEKCENCKYGYIESKCRKITRVYCKKFNSDINTSLYKEMKFCLHFERSEIIVHK